MVKQTLTTIEPEARKLRDGAEELREQLAEVESAVKGYVSRCSHSFTVSYDPIYHKGYNVPAWHAGSDSTPEFYVSASTEQRWKRECGKCGLVEYTMRTEAEVHKKPVW